MEPAMRRNTTLEEAVADAERRYVAANPLSQARYERSCQVMPGGNTRAALFYDPYPVTMAGGEGAHLHDLDGHRYLDFLGEFTAGLYGHSNPVIYGAIAKALDSGIVLGGPNEYETQLAELFVQRFPSCQSVRFCNSGTEANLMAVTLARAVTRRSHIMVFDGAYHGAVLNFGPGGEATNAPFPVLRSTYNDAQAARDMIEAHARDLAAIIVEPMMGNAGGIAGEREFLNELRAGCDRCGIVLIFDEVMTSRLGSGGLQSRFGFLPDLATYGKYLGGGLTFGAFGGRADLMDRFDPRRPDTLRHSGTYNNNVLTMAAGVAGLSEVFTPRAAARLNAAGDAMRDRLNTTASRLGVPAIVAGLGSILVVHFQDGLIRTSADANRTPPAMRKLFHLAMIEAGFYVARRGFMSLSLAMTEDHHDAFASAFEDYLRLHAPLLAA